MHSGSCNCGAVRFTLDGPIAPPSACHCRECRKQTGHFEVSTDIPRSALSVTGGDSVTWYHTSPKVRRGFCSICGSNLFWDPIHHDWTAIAMGAFDTPTDTALKGHIFVSEKGDYYELSDGLPQNAR